MRMLLGIAAFFTLIGFTLTNIAFFTKYWWYDSYYNGGVIPFDSRYDTWYQAVCYLMYIAYGLYCLAVVTFIIILIKASRDSCLHGGKPLLYLCSLLNSTLATLEAIAFIILATQINDYNTVGYSAYLALAAACFALLVSSICSYTARRRCH